MKQGDVVPPADKLSACQVNTLVIYHPNKLSRYSHKPLTPNTPAALAHLQLPNPRAHAPPKNPHLRLRWPLTSLLAHPPRPQHHCPQAHPYLCATGA